MSTSTSPESNFAPIPRDFLIYWNFILKKMRCFVFLLVLGLSSAAIENRRSARRALSQRNAITDPARLWPNGRVPVVFDDSVYAYKKVQILAAMKQVELSTYSHGTPCVQFVSRQSEADYIEISVDQFRGYSLSIGRRGGKQIFTVDDHHSHDLVLTGLMNQLGFYPEVTRPDRDNYVTVYPSNIQSSYLSNFAIINETDFFGQAFDYESVLMYSPYSDAIVPSSPTIRAQNDGYVFGQAISLSDGDVSLIQRVYKCSLDANHRIDMLGNVEAKCHFHTDLCHFANDHNDDFDWILHRGTTYTANTGPNADFSSGAGGYALAEGRAHNNQRARLISPTLAAGQFCLKMRNYLYGADIGTLRLIIKTSLGDKVLGEIGENQSSAWYLASTTIESKIPFQVVFEARIGTGDKSDMALDDIYIYPGKCIDWTH